MITDKHWLILERVIEGRQLTTLTMMITEISYNDWGKFYQAFCGRFAMCGNDISMIIFTLQLQKVFKTRRQAHYGSRLVLKILHFRPTRQKPAA